MKLRTKILSYTLPLIFIPFLLTALAVYYFVIRANQIQIEEEKKQRLNEVIINIGQEIDSTRKDIETLSNVPAIKNYLSKKDNLNKENAKTVLELFFKQNPYYLELSLVDEKGQEQIKFSKIPNHQELESIKNENYFRRTLITGGVQTPVVEFQSSKYKTIFTRSIVREKFVGLLVLSLNAEIFERKMRPLLMRDLNTFIFDDRGIILASVSNSKNKKGFLKEASLANEATELLSDSSFESQERTINYEDGQYVLTFLPAESFPVLQSNFGKPAGTNWFLGVIEPKKSISVPMSFQIFFFSLLFLTVGGVLLLATKASSYITIPLEKVTSATNKIARGDSDLELNVRTGDEVEDLANAVSRMNHDLQDYQKQIVQSAKLATMGEMTSEISHEIQNRISGISLWLQHLDSEIDKDDSRKEYLDEMKLGLNSFMQMLADLKGYYKKPALNLSSININSLVDDALLFVDEKIDEKKINIQLSLQMTLPDIKGDEEKLKSVILNLLLNAIDSVDREGEIIIKTDTLVKREKEKIILKIKDNGRGIKEKDLSKIFYPFYSTKSSGSGLGLAISSNIVSAHNGSIQVESRVGEGTIFTILLPIN